MDTALLDRLFRAMEETARVNPRFTVVIPAFNAESTVAETVRAVVTQPLARDTFECIVVDDGSRDRTAETAERAGALVVRLPENQGPSAARNAGIQHARGEWIAFTDADCVPSRRWLPAFLSAAETADRATLALAGRTIGLESKTPAARFMDLIGALDAETYLHHQEMPWAPSCNLAYRRADLQAVGGFDRTFRWYETPEIHLRMTESFGGRILHVPAAIVMHRHRATWKSFWKQQLGYGRGYAHFLLRHAGRWPWSMEREAGAWAYLLVLATRAAAARGEQGLVRRGYLLKQIAHRVGFAATFFSPWERRRWQRSAAVPSRSVPGAPPTDDNFQTCFASDPLRQRTAALRPSRMSGSGLPLWLAVGHFIARAPARLARSELPAFLARVAAQPRDGSDFARVARLARRWLRLSPLRSRDTCYLRSLVLFRFVDARDGELCLHFGVDEPRASGERLHGHAWISLNGNALNPPGTLAEGRLREIYRFSTLNGGSSTSGATFAGAMIRRGAAAPVSAQPMPV
jgi:glycosyltransferase involved in cell wall biosynthesis